MNKPRLKRRSFALQAAGAPFVWGGPQRQGRPNIVLVMMDDFGVGQFAPHALRIEQLLQVDERLERIFIGQARYWPPPKAWDREHWKALMPTNNVHLR